MPKFSPYKKGKQSPKRSVRRKAQPRQTEFQSIRFASAIADDAEALITKMVGKRYHPDPDRIEMIKLLSTKIEQASKLSEKQHVELLASVYATYVYLQMDERCSEFINDMAQSINFQIQKNTDPLSIVLRRRLSYGGQPSEGKDPARGLYQRDVRAIRYLIDQGVTPSQLVEEIAPKGEGLDEWSRRYSESKRAVELTDGAEPTSSLTTPPRSVSSSAKNPTMKRIGVHLNFGLRESEKSQLAVPSQVETRAEDYCGIAIAVVDQDGESSNLAIRDPGHVRAFNLFTQIVTEIEGSDGSGWTPAHARALRDVKELLSKRR